MLHLRFEFEVHFDSEPQRFELEAHIVDLFEVQILGEFAQGMVEFEVLNFVRDFDQYMADLIFEVQIGLLL